jgi:hypothetical protein
LFLSWVIVGFVVWVVAVGRGGGYPSIEPTRRYVFAVVYMISSVYLISFVYFPSLCRAFDRLLAVLVRGGRGVFAPLGCPVW